MNTLFVQYFQSPLGLIKVMATNVGVQMVDFVEEKDEIENNNTITKSTISQLTHYFSGKLTHFDLPLCPIGTDFQTKVWEALQKIPYGATLSYLQLSKRMGNTKAIRAVGKANGQNPIAIIIPCHRVIGSNGSLVGYAGGLWRKKALLQLEGVLVQQELF